MNLNVLAKTINIQDIDITETCRRDYENYKSDPDYKSFADFCCQSHGKPSVFTGESLFNKDYKYGYVLLNKAGEVDKVIKRTNPNSKWDWYVIGGRWSGLLRLKPEYKDKYKSPDVYDTFHAGHNQSEEDRLSEGLYVDSCLKGEVDWDYMRTKAAQEAAESYDAVMEFLGHTPINKTWKEFLKKVDNKEIAIEEARTEYYLQPRCNCWKAQQAEQSIINSKNLPNVEKLITIQMQRETFMKKESPLIFRG
jgi:hypothetical protein